MRTLALLIGLMGIGLAPRSALAVGCHVEDRPTIGLSSIAELRQVSSNVLSRATLPRERPQVRPMPCSGELPGSMPQASTLGLAIEPATLDTVLPEAARVEFPRRKSLSSRFADCDVSRPPRAELALV